MRPVPVSIVILLIGAAIPLQAPRAFACSISGPPDARAALQQAQAAFVGALISKDSRGGPTFDNSEKVTLSFLVEWAVKGPIGRRVKVESSGPCGLGTLAMSPGQRIGLVVSGTEDQWTAHLGSTVAPDELLRATRRLTIDGKGPPAFFVHGQFDRVNTLAIDEAGGKIGYANAAGTLVPCPGGKRMVDFQMVQPLMPSITVRDVRTFEAISPSVTIPEAAGLRSEVSCRDDQASELLVFATSVQHRLVARARVFRVRGNHVDRLADLRAAAGAFHPVRDVLFVGEGTYGHELVELDLRTGRRRPLASISADVRSLALSPSGGHIAVASTDDPFVKGETYSTISIVNVAAATARTLKSDRDNGVMVWTDDHTVAFVSGGFAPARLVRVYNVALKEIGRFGPWPSKAFSVARDGALYGVSFEGLFTASPPSGPIREIGRIRDLDLAASNLVVVPAGVGSVAWPVPPQGERLQPRYLGSIDFVVQAGSRSWALIFSGGVLTGLAAAGLAYRASRRRRTIGQPAR